MINSIDMKKCNGCYACYNICPEDAISMTMDNEGFNYPTVNMNNCTQCGKCMSVCPVNNVPESRNQKAPEVYAAWSLDDEIRANSTSGGIFSELAARVLQQSGYVCGAIYNSEKMVEHYITCDLEELKKIRQSKYVQSSINFSFRTIGELLIHGMQILFCGTPCECAAIDSYLNESSISKENLILIDFVCRGSNSPKVYIKFLNSLEEKYGAEVERVWFKNKTYGWNRFSTRIDFSNGSSYLEDRYSDIYIRGYIEANLYIRPSCGECLFKGFPRISDITLGDFWGVELEEKDRDVDQGTSLVIINSDKGERIFRDIKQRIFIERKKLEDAVGCNPCIYESISHGINRDKFMKDLDQIDVMENIRRYLK